MQRPFIFCFLILFLFSCKKRKVKPIIDASQSKLECSDYSCKGFYSGPEFINGDDIAHQYSNTMSSVVGNKLKELYNKGLFSKVNFEEISMTTIGMGTGNVRYSLIIPFSRVDDKCKAYTSFDHVGG